MICPACTFDNLPGAEHCTRCMQDLTQLDQPTPYNRVERSLMEDPVRLLSPRRPITVGAKVTVREALQKMLAHDIGSLLVVDERGRLVGIFSERDLLTKVAGAPVADTKMIVESVMTPNP
jgi:CBS-domain-containing membrane protein